MPKAISTSLILLFSVLIFFGCSTESTPVYQLSTSADPAEAGSVTPSEGEYEEGEQIEVMASPNEHWVFDRWQGDHTGKANPANITINSDTDVTAIFTKREYPLSVNTEGEGSVSERIVQAKSTDYPHGTTVELTANPVDDWVFTGWSGDLTEVENPQTINVEGETSVTATFKSVDELLNIEIEGDGSIELDQEDSSENPSRSNIQITASPSAGWKFVEWNGDLTGSENPQTLTLDGEKSIEAVFDREEYSVDISLVGNGNVSITPEQETYFGGDVITISVEPDDGWNFVFWDGDLEGTDNPIEFTLDQNITATANLDESPFAGGNGSEMYPYQVATVHQLQEVRNYTDRHFVQINDIDASETVNWNNGEGFNPIGGSVIPFEGVYDGNNFELLKVHINREAEDDVGLFGVVKDAIVKNIGMIDSFVWGGIRVGGVVGRNTNSLVSNSFFYGTVTGQRHTVGGLVGYNNGIVENSHTIGEVNGSSSVGGLVGANDDQINNSYSRSKVIGYSNWIGGLVGENYNLINSSYSTGNVTGDGINIGGLTGRNSGGQISNSQAYGNITGNDINVGGFTGNNSGEIWDSYSTGDVFGVSQVGGFTGDNRGLIENTYHIGKVEGKSIVGGLVGVNDKDAEVFTSYSSGYLYGDEDVGGIIGLNGATIESSYWDSETSNQSNGVGRGNSDGVTGLSTSQMQGSSAKENMPEFDWVEIWKTVQNDYPILRWQDD